MIAISFIFIFCSLELTLSSSSYQTKIFVNFLAAPRPLHKFWTSTGFCPLGVKEDYRETFLSKDVKVNLAFISAIPNDGITNVRIHWLLDLLKLRYSIQDRNLVLNYTDLDSIIDWMHSHRLSPGFELMGNPSDFFDNFENRTQVKIWKRMVRQVSRRYIKKFGIDPMTKWRFETWNEPDLVVYNRLNLTLNAYLNYVDACAAGLNHKRLGVKLRIGGPAGLFKSPERHPLCWGLLQHCSTSHCPLDYLSFHAKGDATTTGVLDKGLHFVDVIHNTYPALTQLPLANDEADPMEGWSTSYDWRSDVRYAAMVAKIIVDHQITIVGQYKVKLEVLSNDNAFLNFHPYYFSQRTLLTRFQMNNTNPPHIQFIQKPIYALMGLLSILGEIQLNTVQSSNSDPRISVIAAATTKKNATSGSILLVYLNETENNPNLHHNITLTLRNFPKYGNSMYVIYYLDNVVSNPSKIWQSFGSPVFPNTTVLQRMRKFQVASPEYLIHRELTEARQGKVSSRPFLRILQEVAPRRFMYIVLNQGPFMYRNLSKISGETEVKLLLTASLPSVTLVHICGGEHRAPGQVTRLELLNVTFNQVLVFWSDEAVAAKCIKTYEVEFARNLRNLSDFRRVNIQDTIFLTFQYVVHNSIRAVAGRTTAGQEGTAGWYRVRAVDFWGLPGPYSRIVKYSKTSTAANTGTEN